MDINLSDEEAGLLRSLVRMDRTRQHRQMTALVNKFGEEADLSRKLVKLDMLDALECKLKG